MGWLRLAAPGLGHEKPGPVPGDRAAGSASPGSARRGASLQSCRRVPTGSAGALDEHNGASSSPFHPGHTLLSLLAEGSRPARSPGGSVLVPKASSYFQALFSTHPCFLQGWTGSKAASHKSLVALISLSLGLTAAARLVLDSRSHLKLQGSGLQSCPPSLTKAIQTLPGRRRESQHPVNHPRHSCAAPKTLLLIFSSLQATVPATVTHL